jgi:4-alpha-glucanotransferase
MKRRSGVLLPLFSLPGPEPVGTFGRSALEFADFLAAGGFSLWQILPLPPEGLLESPYAGKSAFAIDPFQISLPDLVEEGLLDASSLREALASQPPEAEGSRVPWVEMRAWKAPYLERASLAVPDAFLEAWLARAPWADDWALWWALSRHHGSSWTRWPALQRDREPGALASAREVLRRDWRLAAALQWIADRQWASFKTGLEARGIALLGDIPLYVAADGADVWAERRLFQLDASGEPTVVAGVPPDPFCDEGQRWGNPVFDWDFSESTDHAWWRARLRRALELADLIRIDHFRGFEAWWSFAAEQEPREGVWRPGPGLALFQALRRELATCRGLPPEQAATLELPLVAEDLGIITAEVEKLREDLGIPGMKVLQFAWDGDARNPYHPSRIEGSRWLVCTGTHDMDTTNAWYRSTFPWCRENFERFTGHSGPDAASTLVRLALASPAELAVAPYQDLLGLGSESRINVPGTQDPANWSWRAPRPPDGLAARYRELNERYQRTAAPA